jgi:hypothetical protein
MSFVLNYERRKGINESFDAIADLHPKAVASLCHTIMACPKVCCGVGI